MASGADFELLCLQPDVSAHVAQFLYHSHSKGLSSPESPSVCLVDSVNRHVVFQVFSTPPDLHYYWNLLDYGFIMTVYDNGFALQVKRGLEAWRSWSSPGWKLLLLEDVASARKDDLSPIRYGTENADTRHGDERLTTCIMRLAAITGTLQLAWFSVFSATWKLHRSPERVLMTCLHGIFLNYDGT